MNHKCIDKSASLKSSLLIYEANRDATEGYYPLTILVEAASPAELGDVEGVGLHELDIVGGTLREGDLLTGGTLVVVALEDLNADGITGERGLVHGLTKKGQ